MAQQEGAHSERPEQIRRGDRRDDRERSELEGDAGAGLADGHRRDATPPDPPAHLGEERLVLATCHCRVDGAVLQHPAEPDPDRADEAEHHQHGGLPSRRCVARCMGVCGFFAPR